jgi:hypothetical protein
MLLASWKRRRVFRSWKKLFQSSFGVGDADEPAGELAVEPDVDIVLAFLRAVNWHWRDMGFRGVVWKEILVEICLDGTRAVHGCRASGTNDE